MALKLWHLLNIFTNFLDLKFSLIPTVDYVDSGWPEYGLSTGGCHSGTYWLSLSPTMLSQQYWQYWRCVHNTDNTGVVCTILKLCSLYWSYWTYKVGYTNTTDNTSCTIALLIESALGWRSINAAYWGPAYLDKAGNGKHKLGSSKNFGLSSARV